MDIRKYLKENVLFLDGGMGTILQKKGLKAGERPERWNLTHSDVIVGVHKDYFDSGSNVVCTNTFGANSLKYEIDELESVIFSAVANARKAQALTKGAQPTWVALDVGPTGKMLAPFGDLSFEEAVETFKATVSLGVKAGVDLVLIETMSDSYETKAALLAVKETTDLPVFVSNAYSENERLLTGATPEAMVALLEGMGADAIGVNCSFGPEKLSPIVRKYLECASTPILLKPNAGLPKVENGETKYDITEEEFGTIVARLVEEGVRIAGGCCGTTPKHVKALTARASGIKVKEISKKEWAVVSSFKKAVEIGKVPIIIGERINPTGKPRFKEALREGNLAYAVREGIEQEERGAHVLDVNVGIPEIDEVATLKKVVTELQAVSSLPLEIDTSNPLAMEQALRVYNGKALINSVSCVEESTSKVFPLAKKYGGVVVCLTIDENGIPATAEERVAVAERLYAMAKHYGLEKKDLLIDPLALTIGADKNSALVTLKALRLLKERGFNTVLGVSNVSYGLPNRDYVNSTFFALALASGLSAGIVNPLSREMMKAYHSYLALSGQDENLQGYISFANALTESTIAPTKKALTLSESITRGLKGGVEEMVSELLSKKDGVTVINEEIIPALDKVGVAYEEGRAYLPNLLMSAEVAKLAFEVIKGSIKGGSAVKGDFIIATVKGDVHDIGKNIVKMLLENYGFNVIDLGKDTPIERVVDEVLKRKAPLLGLSALMTTTVPNMALTIKAVREVAPWCKICVGGAVLTKEYAEEIGADKYCKDAMETVRYALSVVE